MRQLERFFDLSLDMLCIAGFDGYFKRVNPAFREVLGYEEAELLELPFMELVHPDDRPSTTEAMSCLREGRPVIDFENRYVTKSGSLRWLSWRARAEEDLIYGVARDVTESKRLERLLRAREILRSVAEGTAAATGTEYFRSLVYHLASALGVRYCFLSECFGETAGWARTLAFWDGEDFVENFEYEVENTPCRKVFGGETCLVGRRVQELFPNDQELAKLEAESYVAVPMLSSSGEVLGLLAAMDVKPLAKDDPDTSLLRIFSDRAGAELERHRAEQERERLQTQLLHAQKLESLGVLAGGIAHDFNNILVGILGNAGLALAELLPGSLARPFLERIEQAAQRAADLANQMLAYSGRGQFVVRTFQLEELVEEMADLLRSSVSKKADLRLRRAAEIPTVEADATQIRQVALNLITNASDALGDDSGTITVDIDTLNAAPTDLDETLPGNELRPGRYVQLKVSDTGCGMDEETRNRIFDPFFTTKRTGRGLGMAAVLGIVRGHKGAIRVKSEPGHGTTFEVLLPASGEASAAPQELKAAPSDRGVSGKILVVDDEDMVRQVAQFTLERTGREVLLAADGREALQVFLREGRDIVAVVLDLTMPWMSGEETFHELRRLSPEVPVILTSGYNEQDAAARFRFDSQGPASFLKKPYRPRELVEMVESVLA